MDSDINLLSQEEFSYQFHSRGVLIQMVAIMSTGHIQHLRCEIQIVLTRRLVASQSQL
jgi:hypothetical protein